MHPIRPSIFVLCAGVLCAQDPPTLPKAPASQRDCIIWDGEADHPVYAWSIRDQAYVTFKHDSFGGNEQIWVIPRGSTILQPGHTMPYQLAALSRYADQEKVVYQWVHCPGKAPEPSQFRGTRIVKDGPVLEIEYQTWTPQGMTVVRPPHRFDDPLSYGRWVTQDFWVQITDGTKPQSLEVFACGYLNGKMVAYGRGSIAINSPIGYQEGTTESESYKKDFHAFTDEELKQKNDLQTNSWKLAPDEFLVDPATGSEDEIRAELVRQVKASKPQGE